MKWFCIGFKELNWFILFKNILSSSIIFLLLYFLILPLHSSYLSIQHRKKMLRREIKRKIIAGLDEKELVSLKFALTDLQKKLKWKHSKEFEFNGEMYDIVTVKKIKDSIEYHCWWDSEESLLNRKLMALVGINLADLPGNRDLQFNLSNFYKNIFFQKAGGFVLQCVKFEKFRNNSSFNNSEPDKIISGFISTYSPPPEIL
jgi:hypothetical protein